MENNVGGRKHANKEAAIKHIKQQERKLIFIENFMVEDMKKTWQRLNQKRVEK